MLVAPDATIAQDLLAGPAGYPGERSVHYVMIDFENVQPKDLGRIKVGEVGIRVFLGQHQSKLHLDIVQALLPFGTNVRLIPITGSGPDAVDFHIAFYIGRISKADPTAKFTIVSKDRGFDPLVKHLCERGIACARSAEIPAPEAAAVPASRPAAKTAAAKAAPATSVLRKTPAPKVPPAAAAKKASVALATPSPSALPSTTRARVKVVLDQLRKTTKPATVATLRSAINAHFRKMLEPKELDAILQSLAGSKRIVVTGTKVAYHLD